MAPNFWARRLASWLLLGALLALAFWSGADQIAQQWTQDWRQSPGGKAWGQTAYWSGLGGAQAGALALLGLWGWRARRPEHLWAGAAGIAAVALSGGLVQVCKHLVGRPRPRLAMSINEYFGPTFKSDLLSFPSGHATTSFAVAAALSAFYPRKAWLFYVLATLISLGRVVSNAHHLSDVLAGAMLGLAVGWPIGRLLLARADRRP